VPERELVRIAIRSLGLSELGTFDPDTKIIEYAMRDSGQTRLVDRSVEDFVYATAADSPAPGGGSVSAAVGALGAALGAMVANLSSHKRGWDDRWEFFSGWAERGMQAANRLLRLVDDDTRAFNAVLLAFGLPRDTPAEREARTRAIREATRGAIAVPLLVMEAAVEALEVVAEMTEQGLPSSVSDGGVGALCARTAVRGAGLNVRINLDGFDDQAYAAEAVSRAEALERRAEELETRALAAVTKPRK
jgi:glutamate formiminotransferase/formiminotetrahydrofolate cyclodeaminase